MDTTNSTEEKVGHVERGKNECSNEVSHLISEEHELQSKRENKVQTNVQISENLDVGNYSSEHFVEANNLQIFTSEESIITVDNDSHSAELGVKSTRIDRDESTTTGVFDEKICSEIMTHSQAVAEQLEDEQKKPLVVDKNSQENFGDTQATLHKFNGNIVKQSPTGNPQISYSEKNIDISLEKVRDAQSPPVLEEKTVKLLETEPDSPEVESSTTEDDDEKSNLDMKVESAQAELSPEIGTNSNELVNQVEVFSTVIASNIFTHQNSEALNANISHSESLDIELVASSVFNSDSQVFSDEQVAPSNQTENLTVEASMSVEHQESIVQTVIDTSLLLKPLEMRSPVFPVEQKSPEESLLMPLSQSPISPGTAVVITPYPIPPTPMLESHHRPSRCSISLNDGSLQSLEYNSRTSNAFGESRDFPRSESRRNSSPSISRTRDDPHHEHKDTDELTEMMLNQKFEAALAAGGFHSVTTDIGELDESEILAERKKRLSRTERQEMFEKDKAQLIRISSVNSIPSNQSNRVVEVKSPAHGADVSSPNRSPISESEVKQFEGPLLDDSQREKQFVERLKGKGLETAAISQARERVQMMERTRKLFSKISAATFEYSKHLDKIVKEELESNHSIEKDIVFYGTSSESYSNLVSDLAAQAEAHRIFANSLITTICENIREDVQFLNDEYRKLEMKEAALHDRLDLFKKNVSLSRHKAVKYLDLAGKFSNPKKSGFKLSMTMSIQGQTSPAEVGKKLSHYATSYDRSLKNSNEFIDQLSLFYSPCF